MDGKILAEAGYGKNIATMPRPAPSSKSLPMKPVDKKSIPGRLDVPKPKAYYDLEGKSSNMYHSFYLSQQNNASSTSFDSSPSKGALLSVPVQEAQQAIRSKQQSLTNVTGTWSNFFLSGDSSCERSSHFAGFI